MTARIKIISLVTVVVTGLFGCTSASSEAPSTTIDGGAITTSTTSTQPVSTTTSTLPGDAIVVEPGTNLRQLVDQSEPGAVFVLRAGTHRSDDPDAHVVAKPGQSFHGERGAVMDGGGATTFAFWDGGQLAPNVTISGLVIENYANPLERGAIDAGSPGWRLVGNEVRFNAGAGVVLSGDDLTIERNVIHHNSQIGIVVQDSRDSAIVGNEIAHNNPNDEHDPAWEAGGTKFLRTRDLFVAENHVHDNHGPGLWTDHDNVGTVYERNRVADNTGPGIFHEISGSAVIRDNIVTDNAHGFYMAGILIANSDHVTVTGNVVSGNNGGVVGLQEHRDGPLLVNLEVTSNTISHRHGVTGLVIQGGPDVTRSGSIVFRENVYELGATRPFQWGSRKLTMTEWLELGHDP